MVVKEKNTDNGRTEKFEIKLNTIADKDSKRLCC